MQENQDIGSLSEEEKRRGFAGDIKYMRPCDDVLMAKIFSHKECVECVLKPILKLTDLEIVRVETHRMVEGIEPGRRAIEFDILAWDAKGNPYNIEFQRDGRGMSIRRTRLYGDALDLLASKRGMRFDGLPDTYMVIICEYDMFKRGKPVYTERTFIEETGELVDTGRHVKYVNAPLLMRDNATELGRLVHDLWCVDPEKMYNRELADVVGLYKNSVEGKMEFTGFIGKLVDYEREQAESRGETKGKLGTLMQVMKNLMSLHKYSEDKAMDEMGLSREEREELRQFMLEAAHK